MTEDSSHVDSGEAAQGPGIGPPGTASSTGGVGGPSGDDLLAGVRRLAGLARELGISDLSGVSALLEQARQEGKGGDLFRSLKSLVDQFTAPGPGSASGPSSGPASAVSDPGEWPKAGGRDRPSGSATKSGPTRNAATAADTNDAVAAREAGAHAQNALLHRIEELSRTATIEGIVALAGAYAQVRAAGRPPFDPREPAPRPR